MTLREQLSGLKREPLIELGKRLNFVHGAGKATFGTDTERKTNEQLVDFLLARYSASQFFAEGFTVGEPVVVRDEVRETAWDQNMPDEDTATPAEVLGSKPPFNPKWASASVADSEARLILTLRELMGSRGGAVDEDTVRRIVTEEVARVTRVVSIERKGYDAVKIDGAHPALEKVLKLLAQGVNVMLVGPAGCGKTHLAGQVAEALRRAFASCSFSGGITESALTGRLLPVKAGGTFAFLPAPFLRMFSEGGVFLADELDAADANVLLVLNAALSNGHLEVEGLAANGEATRVERHADFVMIAAANTFGNGADAKYVGRGALDGATLDRFYIVAMDYDERFERSLFASSSNANVRAIGEWVLTVRAATLKAGIERIVSTRMIQKGIAGVLADLPLSEVKADLLAGWSADEKRAVNA